MALGSGAAGCIKDKPLTQAVILLRPIACGSRWNDRVARVAYGGKGTSELWPTVEILELARPTVENICR
jgi:hypothetical protein